MLTWTERAFGHAILPALVGTLTFATAVVTAQVPLPDPARPLASVNGSITLGMALSQALARNPDLQGFSHRLRAQDARIETAGLRPPVELRMELENFAGTGANKGVDVAEATFALSHVIEMGGKRELREGVARASRDDLDVERQAAQLDVVAEVTRRFIHVASDQEQLALTRRATQLAQSSLEAVQKRVTAGRAPDAELNRAKVAVARADIDEEHAEHELLASRRKLAAMWGDTEPVFGEAIGDLYQYPTLPEFEAIIARVDRNPDFLRFASEARVRDAEVRLAQARTRADFTVSAGIRRLEATDDQAMVVGVSIPLFARSRSRGAVEEAQAARSLTDAEQSARRVRVNAQLFEIYQELRHAITEATMLRDVVLPEVEAALRNTQVAFDRGRYSYLEWTDAQRELIAGQRDRIQASTNAHLFLAEIERLTSAPVSDMPQGRK